jgi:hypothetical protein
LTLLLTAQTPWDDHTVAELVQPGALRAIPELTPQAVNLSIYDQLLMTEACHVTA